jgi:hypothetical protein
MTSVTTHDWTVSGPGGDYGVMEYAVGSKIGCYFMAGPLHVTVPVSLFTIALIALLFMLFAAVYFYARHRRALPNAT